MTFSLYERDSELKAIWVVLEHQDSQLKPVSTELLSKGRELADQTGWELTGLLLGYRVEALAAEAFSYGADTIIICDDQKLERFTVDVYTHVVHKAVEKFRPSVLLLGATPDSRDVAGRLAVRLRTGLNADCTQLNMDPKNEVLVCEVSGFGGGVLALIEMAEHRPQMATVRPGVFRPLRLSGETAGAVTRFEIEIPEAVLRTQVIERSLGEGLDLAKAQVLVVGGRGVEDNFGMIETLAHLLGGDFGATRPPVDDGLVKRERQIGQTGVVCRPEIVLVCGASGAFHFIVGIQEAGIVFAINSDPEAPVFDYADYCIVADVQEIIPRLNRLLAGERDGTVESHRFAEEIR